MEGEPADPHSDLLQAVLQHCSPFRFEKPWGFLDVDKLCRGPIVHPAEVLQKLCVKYPLGKLQEGNLVDQTPGQGWRLRPELCHPGGAVIGLRNRPADVISVLLTPRGSLPQRLNPWMLANTDEQTRGGMEAAGVLLVTFSLRDALVFRSLGIPAVPGLGMHRLELSVLQALNELQGYEDYAPVMQPDDQPTVVIAERKQGKPVAPASSAPLKSTAASPKCTDGKPLAPKGSAPSNLAGMSAKESDAKPANPTSTAPRKTSVATASVKNDTPTEPQSAALANSASEKQITLILIPWSVSQLTYPFDDQLERVSNQISQLRRFMAMDFAGLLVWKITAEQMENLRFRLTLQDPEPIADLIRTCIHQLRDIENFASAEVSLSVKPDLASMHLLDAKAGLMDELGRESCQGKRSNRVQSAHTVYQKLVQRDLIRPLQEWALDHPNPCVRVAGVQLADVCEALHQMQPYLQAVPDRKRHNGVHQSLGRSGGTSLDVYVKLCNQFSSLIRDLYLLRKF